MRPVIFGEVLYDRFPDGRVVLGGAPFNVAWNLQALGVAPLFVSRVGDDELGADIRTAMTNWGMDTSGLETDTEHPTGTVEVTFDEGEPSYDIAPDKAYDFIAGEVTLPADQMLLYHGTLAQRAAGSRETLVQWRQATAAAVFVDVNLRDPWWNRAAALDTLRGVRWVKLNEAELDALVPNRPDRVSRAAFLVAEFDLTCLIVTLGAAGVAAYGPDGWTYALPATVRGEIVDTVGAGDAFSSVALLGLVRGWPWELTLARAQELAGAVVGLRGATTGDRAFYENIVTNWENT